jgi:hypothetical protein
MPLSGKLLAWVEPRGDDELRARGRTASLTPR